MPPPRVFVPRPTIKKLPRRKPPELLAAQVTFRPVGNAKRWNDVRAWVRGDASQSLLLLGPCGAGKTHGVYELAREARMAVYEVNASDDALIGGAQLARDLYEVCTRSYNGRRTLVLLDDVDAFPPPALESLIGFLRAHGAGSLRFPVVCTCTSTEPRAVRTLRGVVQRTVALGAVDDDALRALASARFPKKLRETVDAAIRACRGDLRRFLRAMDVGGRINGVADARPTIFDTIRALLRGVRVAGGVGAHEEGVHDLLFENYLRPAPLAAAAAADGDAVATAAEWLALTDTMRARPAGALTREGEALLCAAPTGNLGALDVRFPRKHVAERAFAR